MHSFEYIKALSIFFFANQNYTTVKQKYEFNHVFHIQAQMGKEKKENLLNIPLKQVYKHVALAILGVISPQHSKGLCPDYFLQ